MGESVVGADVVDGNNLVAAVEFAVRVVGDLPSAARVKQTVFRIRVLPACECGEPAQQYEQ